MYNKVKLTRRQIKEDKFATFIFSSKQQIQENWQFFVIGLIVIVLMVVGINYYLSSKSSADLDAATRYSSAYSNYNQGNKLLAITSFTQILSDFPGTKVAQQSTYMLGKANLDNRNYTEAARYFQMYVDKYSDDPLYKAGSLAGLAACSELQGEFAPAAQKYLTAYKSDESGPLAGDYLASAMRNFLAAGEIDQASVQLDIIKKKYANTDLARNAELQFFEISNRN